MDLASILNNSDPRELIKRGNEVDPELLNRYVQNRAINEPAFSSLIVAYSILIVVGALGNTLVVSRTITITFNFFVKSTIKIVKKILETEF